MKYVVSVRNVETGHVFTATTTFTVRWAKEMAKRYYRWIGEGGIDVTVSDKDGKTVWDIQNVRPSHVVRVDDSGIPF